MKTYTTTAYLRGAFLAPPLLIFWLLARLVPVHIASNMGGRLFALFGPLAAKQKHVLNNLAIVAPQLDQAELKQLSRLVWCNLGAVLAEYPHLRQIAAQRVEVDICAEVQQLIDDKQPFAMLSGHLANWEIAPLILDKLGITANIVYTRNSNPLIDWAIQHFRGAQDRHYVDKNDALPVMFDAARSGRSIALLPDQRVDSGTLLDFFHKQAATTISPARIARRLNYPIVPVELQRQANSHFRIRFYAPLQTQVQSSEKDAAIDLTNQFHRMLETWITQNPGHWLCVKRRWPKVRPLRV